MPDPMGIQGLQSGQTASVGQSKPAGGASGSEGPSFKDMLLDSLDQVNRLQQEADQGVEKLITGQTDNMAEVFTAVRKSEVAFSLLMEMRNKLVEAYREVQQMSV